MHHPPPNRRWIVGQNVDDPSPVHERTCCPTPSLSAPLAFRQPRGTPDTSAGLRPEERVEDGGVALVGQEPLGPIDGEPASLVDLIGREEGAVEDGHHPVAHHLRPTL